MHVPDHLQVLTRVVSIFFLLVFHRLRRPAGHETGGASLAFEGDGLSARPLIPQTQAALAAEGTDLRLGQRPQRLKPAGLKPRPFICNGSKRQPGRICFLLVFAFLLAGCGVTGAPVDVAIPALASEDLEGPCRFELSMPHPEEVQQGVLVMYERADTFRLFDDSELRQTLTAMNYSLVWASQCNAKSTGDIQADAGKGPGRVLLAALNQLAVKSGHPELTTNGIILYGFSAAGVLSATMANTQPDRLIGIIQYASGSAFVDLDDVQVTAAAAQIPTLILANALDVPAGTARSLHYFERGRVQAAPWAYAVQNDTTHCCTDSTRNIILPWMRDIAALNAGVTNAAASPPQVGNSGTLASFLCTPNGIVDDENYINCNFTAASLGRPTSSIEQAGWLPDEKSGQAWLAWVTSPQTN